MAVEIGEDDILKLQNAWGDAVVNVGKLMLEKKNYKAAGLELVKRFYGYSDGPVLFKPTRAQHVQFRGTEEGAVSYFVGGNKNFDEDRFNNDLVEENNNE